MMKREVVSIVFMIFGVAAILFLMTGVEAYSTQIQQADEIGSYIDFAQVNPATTAAQQINAMVADTMAQSYTMTDEIVWVHEVHQANAGREVTAQTGTISIPTTKDPMIPECLVMINEERRENGIAPLTWDQNLANSAKVRAEESKDCWSHRRPDGSMYYTVNDDIYAENLGDGMSCHTAQDFFDAWMASPSHRANLMDNELVTIGMATYEVDGHVYWAQEFGM